jgi:hypothetical protein
LIDCGSRVAVYANRDLTHWTYQSLITDFIAAIVRQTVGHIVVFDIPTCEANPTDEWKFADKNVKNSHDGAGLTPRLMQSPGIRPSPRPPGRSQRVRQTVAADRSNANDDAVLLHRVEAGDLTSRITDCPKRPSARSAKGTFVVRLSAGRTQDKSEQRSDNKNEFSVGHCTALPARAAAARLDGRGNGHPHHFHFGVLVACSLLASSRAWRHRHEVL